MSIQNFINQIETTGIISIDLVAPPNSGNLTEIILVSPIEGNGFNGTDFILNISIPNLHRGMFLKKGSYHIYVKEVKTKEDFWEDVHLAICQLVDNDPTKTLPPGIKVLQYMHSVSSSVLYV